MKKSIVFLLISFSTSISAQENILLTVGKSHEIPVSSKEIIRVINSKVITVKDHGNKLELTGKSLGKAELKVGTHTYEVSVINPELFNSIENLKILTEEMMGVSITATPSEVLVGGELLRLSDWIKLGHDSRFSHLKWSFQAALPPSLELQARKFFEKLISDSKLAQPTIILKPKALALVSKDYEDLIPRYQGLLEPYGFKIEKDPKSVNLEPMVEVIVQIVEVKKSDFTSLGISPPQQISGGWNQNGEFKLNTDQLSISLKALVGNGNAKILANPKILCRSGKEAHFLAGGEFPIKIVNFKINDIQWKKHGIILNVRPLADTSGRLSLFIYTEISLMDQSTAVDGIPGLFVNRIESHLDLSESKTVALSGLVKHYFGESSGGLPILSKLPVLGNLFSSKDFREEKTDLVIFITPRVLKENEI